MKLQRVSRIKEDLKLKKDQGGPIQYCEKSYEKDMKY